jgi:glycine/D-amino acid oxidase-like deaminating enzyme
MTAYHAAAQTQTVTVIDRSQVGDPATASFGLTRSVRNDYRDPDYARLAPTMETLRSAEGDRAFPIALDPFGCTRFEMADFADQARNLGVDYVGICCGAGPHHVRAMAEALGREVPAGKYSPSMDLHPMFRADISAKDAAFLHTWTA